MTALGAVLVLLLSSCFQPVASQSGGPKVPQPLVATAAVVGLLLLLLLLATVAVWCCLCRMMARPPSGSLLVESSSTEMDCQDHLSIEHSSSRDICQDHHSIEHSSSRDICQDHHSIEHSSSRDIHKDSAKLTLTLKSHPMRVDEFGDCVSQLHANNNYGFSAQYEMLPSEEAYHSTMLSAENLPYNRFRNIHVYDDNHIALRPHEDYKDIQHTYINASYIDGYSTPKKFIAAQGPLPNTLADFWQMVWQEEVYTVAMVTSLQEHGKKKCEQYWPDTGSCEYGPFEVTTEEQAEMPDYVIRKFQLKHHAEGGLVRSVYHIQFTSWPDHGVPGCTGSMLAFCRHMNAQNNAPCGPILVHCSAGVGRTGTVIAIDIALEQAAKEGVIDVAAIVSKMRKQRMKMIQTAEQLMLVYDAVLEDSMCGDTHIPAGNLNEAIRLLGQQDELGRTGFEKQFQTIQQVSKRSNDVSADSTKDRSQDFLFSDQFGLSNYVHTLFIPRYQDSKGFLITQAPKTNTRENFWKMVCKRESGVIVMLSELEEEGESVCCQYWPESGSESYGKYRVSISSERSCGGYTERTLSISETKNPEVVHKVSHFQLGCWTHEGTCTDPQALIAVFFQVEAVQRSCGNQPIVVHERETASRCGVFCALLNTIECSKAEGTVNVFEMVKTVNAQSPGTVATLEQYQFVYDMMALFLESYSTYSNFK